MTRIRAHRVINGESLEPWGPGTIEVQGTHIASINHALQGELKGAIRLDASDITVLPGLIDAHAHLALVNMGQSAAPVAVVAARIFQNCARALDEGFTVVRDLGGADGALATAINEGLVPGPRVLPSGPVLCQTGGHGDFSACFGVSVHPPLPGLTDPSMCIDGADAARKAARTVIKRGATQLKVVLNGGFSSATTLEQTFLSRVELEPVVEEATRRGLYVTAHIHALEALKFGIAAGIGCVEHGTFFGAPGAELLAQSAIPLIPTLSAVGMLKEKQVEWGIPAHAVVRAQEALSASILSMRAARARNVLLGLGSDLVGAGQRGRAREIVMRAELESPMQAIISATSGNAAAIRLGNEIGKIAPGFHANIIAVRGNPLSDPTILLDETNIVFVMKEGRIFKQTGI